jgi:hypothetical protein
MGKGNMGQFLYGSAIREMNGRLSWDDEDRQKYRESKEDEDGG